MSRWKWEYHSFRCNGSDLARSLDGNGEDGWRLVSIHELTDGEYDYRVVMERRLESK